MIGSRALPGGKKAVNKSERFHFRPEGAVVPRDELLDDVTIAPLTASVSDGSTIQAAIFRFGPNGAIRRHNAAVPQIIAIIQGRGEVSGASGILETMKEGDAVFIAEDEEHETRGGEEGMVALIVEGRGLVPLRKSSPS